MGWQVAASVEQYEAAAGEWLRARPAENTVSLTVIANALATDPSPDDESLYAWWTVDGGVDAGVVAGAASSTPPYGLLLPELPAAAVGELVPVVLAYARPISGVNAPSRTAHAFADCWSRVTGAQPRVRFCMTLHRLDQLLPPAALPVGFARTAGPADVPVAQAMWTAFNSELGFEHGDAALITAARQVAAGHVTLWETSGRPVGLAAHTRPAAGVVRIGPVYTQPSDRGRGVGAAVTAAATRAAHKAAPEVVLFTDRANSAANALYRRLGYQPVAERVDIAFAAAGSSRPGV